LPVWAGQVPLEIVAAEPIPGTTGHHHPATRREGPCAPYGESGIRAAITSSALGVEHDRQTRMGS
jgi:hypothetical protein